MKLNLLQSRIPRGNEIISVFAVAVFMVYTWTMYVSFWNLPSWLMYLEIGEIFSIYAYAFLVNFLESILLLSVALLASLLFIIQLLSMKAGIFSTHVLRACVISD